MSANAFLVYDITRKETFDNLKLWLKEVDTYSTFPEVVKLLVGNKIDLVILRWKIFSFSFSKTIGKSRERWVKI